MPGRGYAQTSSLFEERDSLLVDCMATPVMIGVPPEELTTQFIYVVENLSREKRALHGINRDRGDRGFYEGGSASHQQVPSLPSFYTFTDIIHQILIEASSSTGGKNGRMEEVGELPYYGKETWMLS